MSNWMLKSALVLASVSAFSAPRFDQVAKKSTSPRWCGETALATTISSTTYQGDGFAGPAYTLFNPSLLPPDGSFSLVGLKLKEIVSWKEMVSLELSGAYSHSLGGSTGERQSRGAAAALPAALGVWDADARLFATISLDRSRSVCIEPAVGFALIGADLKTAFEDMPLKNWEQLLFYGPTAGLYMRLSLAPRVSLRVGGNYMASRLRVKKYRSGNEDYYAPGTYAGKYSYRSRRGGLGALVELKYDWKSWVQLHTSVDWQSWSAGGKPANYGGPTTTAYTQATVATPMLSRLQFSWGANFTY